MLQLASSLSEENYVPTTRKSRQVTICELVRPMDMQWHRHAACAHAVGLLLTYATLNEGLRGNI